MNKAKTSIVPLMIQRIHSYRVGLCRLGKPTKFNLVYSLQWILFKLMDSFSGCGMLLQTQTRDSSWGIVASREGSQNSLTTSIITVVQFNQHLGVLTCMISEGELILFHLLLPPAFWDIFIVFLFSIKFPEKSVSMQSVKLVGALQKKHPEEGENMFDDDFIHKKW